MSHSFRPGRLFVVTGVLFLAMCLGTTAFAAVTPRFVVPGQAEAAGVLPRDLATGDVDGDGHTDVVMANDGPAALFHGGVAVLLGDGGGHLAPAAVTPLPQDQGASDVAVADWNGDGLDDAAATASTTGGAGPIFFLTSDGDGTMTVTHQAPNSLESEIAAGDFNGDAKQDLVSSSPDAANVKVYLGNGNGTFVPGGTFHPPFGAQDLATGDLDGDGDTDLVLATGGSPLTMLNDGAAHFTSTGYQFDPKLQGNELTLDRFDADPLLDVAVTDASGGKVHVGLGSGDGHFVPRSEYRVATLSVSGVTSGDFNGDGAADLVTDSNKTDSNIVIMLAGRGDGTFGPFSLWVDGPFGLATANMNADARPDVVSYTQDPGIAYVMLSAGSRGFRAARVTLGKVGGVLRGGDLNGDGRPDVVAGGDAVIPGHIKSFIETYLNHGNGRFGPPVVRAVKEQTAASGVGTIELADVNEDGKLDVAGGFSNFLPSATNLFVSLGNGDGTVQPATLFSNGETNSDVIAMAVSDVTGDAHLDILTSTLNAVSVKPGAGDGTFGAPIISATGSSNTASASMLVRDITGDGTPDLVNTIVTGDENFSSSDVILLRGNGDGTFTEIQRRHIDANVHSGGSADLNGDGTPDVAVIGSQGSDGGHSGMFVFLNAGGTLGTPTRYVRSGTGGLAIADFNLDGAPDIATDALVVNVNAGDGTIEQFVEMIASSSAAVAADFTGDGKPDIVTGASFAPTSGFVLYVNST